MKLRLRKKLVPILLILLFLLLVIYAVVCWFLVDLALVPSFMENTSAFEDVTNQSVAALVQTDDIQNNHAKAVQETNEWLETADARKRKLTSADGYEFTGVSFAPEKESHKWVLLLHGYTGWKEELYPIAFQYVQKGYHALVPDMRCSGESEGDFIGMGWTDRLDNLLWLEKIIQEDPHAEIVIHGQSMGAACALMMSGEALPSQVYAIISDSAYTDAYSMFQKQMKDWFHLPAFPLLDGANLMLQLRGGYNLKEASSLDSVKHCRLPVLVIHGEEDDLVPAEMARTLYDAAPDPKELLIVPEAGHTQAVDKDPGLYYDTVFSFLEKKQSRVP